MDLLIASRQSDLARLQAYQVGQALENLGHKVKYHFRESLGDINQDDPLWKMPEKGVFTEDFREGLENGAWDLVVHSWKDLPIDPLPKTEIVGTMVRADARDLLLFKKKHRSKVQDSKALKIFSSSPRRMYNLTPFFKEFWSHDLQSVDFESVRGNILTRVKKLMEDDSIDGLVVAKAALDRLLLVSGEEFVAGKKELKSFLDQCLFQVLPLSENPTAAAQGALAIEVRKDREELKKALLEIHCENTWRQATREREVLKSHGGGCHQKIGVSCLHLEKNIFQYLRGESEKGEVFDSLEYEGPSLKLTNPCHENLNLFKREPRSFDKDPSFSAHFVTKSDSIPEGTEISEDEVIWVSGVESWKKMAARGYWVSGCSDSLGEEDFRSMGPLFSEKKWYRWTHDSAPHVDGKTTLATYKLTPQETQVDLKKFKEFYWMSGSQFEQALKIEPGILEARHFCGPGHSYTKIQEVLKIYSKEGALSPLPSRKIWLKAVEEYKNANHV